MNINTVIFDMDGLLVDSEPLWKDAGDMVLEKYGIHLSLEQYESTTGLRTKEFLEHWFNYFNLPLNELQQADTEITKVVIELIHEQGKLMPGVEYILQFFKDQNYKIGLASSSPLFLINEVIGKFNIARYFKQVNSAESLPFGKPHPEVYLNCSEALESNPVHCICFEDSYNGMIAVKAAKMKCVVVPAHHQQQLSHWAAADLKISSLLNFNNLLLSSM